MNLKHLTLAVALAGVPALASATQVLATLPVTHSLASALLDGTAVQLTRAAPANLPASRQPSYFSSRGGAALAKAAQQVCHRKGRQDANLAGGGRRVMIPPS